MRVIGLMSGTSYDAIDAAAADIRIDGDTLVLTPLGMVSEPYSGELRAAVAAAVPPASTTVGQICQLDTEIGQAFAAVAARANEELCGGSAELISSHGQTMFHWVEGAQVKGTLQLGQPALDSREDRMHGRVGPALSRRGDGWSGCTTGQCVRRIVAQRKNFGFRRAQSRWHRQRHCSGRRSDIDGRWCRSTDCLRHRPRKCVDRRCGKRIHRGGAVVRSRRCSGRSRHTERRSARTTTERTVLRAAPLPRAQARNCSIGTTYSPHCGATNPCLWPTSSPH